MSASSWVINVLILNIFLKMFLKHVFATLLKWLIKLRSESNKYICFQLTCVTAGENQTLPDFAASQ